LGILSIRLRKVSWLSGMLSYALIVPSSIR
jgi:hypothetical protein